MQLRRRAALASRAAVPGNEVRAFDSVPRTPPFHCGTPLPMNLSGACHSERSSAVGKWGCGTQSKSRVCETVRGRRRGQSRKIYERRRQRSHGILRLRAAPPVGSPARQPPLFPSATSAHRGAPLRMTVRSGRFIPHKLSRTACLIPQDDKGSLFRSEKLAARRAVRPAE